jgi:hypothetical protein
MTTLELNFESSGVIEDCLADLVKLSPVSFQYEVRRPSSSAKLTKPEYLYISISVVLTFQSHDECKKFMAAPGVYDCYQSYAGN